MIIPNKIKIGDKIGIIATARKIALEELNPAIEILESWGLEVVLGKFLFEEDNQFAGTVEQRTIDLQNMIDDDAIKAILCARGGYGTVQIIDKIDFSKLVKNPKWIIGFSDITVLHSHLNQLGVATLHATMPINFSKNTPKSLESLKNSLFGKANSIESPVHKFNRLGKVNAEIIGGNLSILYSLLGSNSDINTDGKILFMEDLDEYLYHIDRMMMNLKRNGCLESLKGIIVGGMTKMKDNDIPWGKDANQIIEDVTSKYNIPIIYNFPAGHMADNRALIMGRQVSIDVNETESKVTFD